MKGITTMNAKKTLTHLIRAGRDALHLENTLNNLGYHETPYFNIHGEIADAIYCMLDEKTDYEDSLTYAAMHDIYTPDEMCAEQLAEMMKSPLTVYETTMEIISETAKEKGITEYQMINLILSDWARKELLLKAFVK